MSTNQINNNSKVEYKEIIPRTGLLYQEEIPSFVLCKPKLMPLKSITIEKLEQMHKEAQEKLREQQNDEKNQF